MLQNALNFPTLCAVAGAAATPALGLPARAQHLKEELIELAVLLKEAHTEQTGAIAKAALGLVITSIELAVPGPGLVEKGGLTLVEWYLCGYIKPASGTKVAKIGLESLEDMEKVSHTVKHIAGRGGKLLTISGIYFDVDEVLEARNKVKGIKQLLEKTKKDMEENADRITEAVAGYRAVCHILETGQAADFRAIQERVRERDGLIKDFDYSLSEAVDWNA
jgi:hypothetical protein